MFRSRSLPAFLFAGLALLCLVESPLGASEELRKGVAEIATSIKQLLASKNEDSIVIGPFTGPANFPTSAGPGIQQLLTEELQKLGITVKKRGNFGIKGEYKINEVPAEEPADLAPERRPKVLAIVLTGTVEDSFGKVVTDFTFRPTVIKGEAAFTELIGAPVDLPPGGTPQERDKKLREGLSKPQTHVNNTRTRLSASPDGKLAIEVLVNGQPRELKDEDGLAFLAQNISRGQTYAVRLINDTNQEMAASLHIDGLSMFQFSELRQPEVLPDGKPNPRKGQPLYSSVIVPPRKDGQPGVVEIKGWHRTNERSDEFLVTEYAKTAGASLNQTGNLGTITVSFRASWPKDQPPPADEPPRQKSTTSGDGTGFGKSFEAKFKEVQRSIGVIRATVSVRYTR